MRKPKVGKLSWTVNLGSYVGKRFWKANIDLERNLETQVVGSQEQLCEHQL
jgi:hypothetical protein